MAEHRKAGGANATGAFGDIQRASGYPESTTRQNSPQHRGKLTVRCVDFKPVQRKTLLGFATVYVAEMRMQIADVAIHERDGRRWAQLPSKPILDANREVKRDDAGKPVYVPVFKFDSKEVERAFSRAVIRAVEEYGFENDFGVRGAE